ncbi:hypothetical protein ACYOEI_30475 [Singulisphaera rosea]
MGQIRDRLLKLVDRPRIAQITRVYPGEPIHNGFILGLGRDGVLLQQFHDFYPEGFVALRVADIKRVRSGERERFWETMFRGEGLMGLVGISYHVPLDEFRSLLAALRDMDRNVIIEIEDRKSDENDDFLIGRVVALDDATVSILNFDPLGVWDDESSVVEYDRITKVQFDTPYGNTLSRYLKGSPPGSGFDPASA